MNCTLTDVNQNVNHSLCFLYDYVAMTLLEDRMKEALKEKGMTPAALGKAIKKPRATVHGWLNGRVQRITFDLLLEVSSLLGVNPEWLNTGKGPKYPNEQANYTASAPDKAELKAVPTANHKDRADAAHRESKTTDDKPDGMDFVILMCNLCDDLIDEGLFPDNRESRRSLYKQADDLVERYENNITIERLEVLLRSLNNIKRFKMVK